MSENLGVGAKKICRKKMQKTQGYLVQIACKLLNETNDDPWSWYMTLEVDTWWLLQLHFVEGGVCHANESQCFQTSDFPRFFRDEKKIPWKGHGDRGDAYHLTRSWEGGRGFRDSGFGGIYGKSYLSQSTQSSESMQLHPWKLIWQWTNNHLKMHLLLFNGDFPMSC